MLIWGDGTILRTFPTFDYPILALLPHAVPFAVCAFTY